MVYGIIQLINFARGETYMFGAFARTFFGDGIRCEYRGSFNWSYDILHAVRHADRKG